MKPTRALSNPSTSSSNKRPRLSHSPFKPIKVASPQDAAAADANPPFSSLMKSLKKGVENVSKGKGVLYWMRMGDLRLNDNRALSLAAEQAAREDIPLLVLFVVSPQDYIAHDRGARRIDFMLRNLQMLKTSLLERNVPLYHLSHTPRRTVPSRVVSFADELDCTRIYGNIEYEVDELRRDLAVCELAKAKAIHVTFVHDKGIIEPGKLFTGQHKPYTVFSPYHRKWISKLNDNVDIQLRNYKFAHSNPASLKTSEVHSFLFNNDIPDFLPGFELSLEQKKLMEEVWPAGEQAANAVLARFLLTRSRHSQLGAVDPLAPGAEESISSSRVSKYANERDRVDSDTTSRMSVYLSSGVISARACVREAMTAQNLQRLEGNRDTGVGRWLQEIAWRDFYIDILATFPRVSMGRPYLEKFASVIWENHRASQDAADNLTRWKEGRTGIPIVDAAMRCLNEMGWIHNRLRMISAMYLTKDLMIDWKVGERYFMQQLMDGDLASNNGGWQWCASTGVDPCPYFRIFNPYLQSAKADPTGEFIRHWVPELRDVKAPEIHNPPSTLANRLNYPRPMIDHNIARDRALRRFKNPGTM